MCLMCVRVSISCVRKNVTYYFYAGLALRVSNDFKEMQNKTVYKKTRTIEIADFCTNTRNAIQINKVITVEAFVTNLWNVYAAAKTIVMDLIGYRPSTAIQSNPYERKTK